MVIVAVFDTAPRLSLTVYVPVTVPSNPMTGVKLSTAEEVTVQVPWMSETVAVVRERPDPGQLLFCRYCHPHPYHWT